MRAQDSGFPVKQQHHIRKRQYSQVKYEMPVYFLCFCLINFFSVKPKVVLLVQLTHVLNWHVLTCQNASENHLLSLTRETYQHNKSYQGVLTCQLPMAPHIVSKNLMAPWGFNLTWHKAPLSQTNQLPT